MYFCNKKNGFVVLCFFKREKKDIWRKNKCNEINKKAHVLQLNAYS